MNWFTAERHTLLRKGALLVILAVCTYLLYYFQYVRHIDVIFSHFFYFPIILACYWWGWNGLWSSLYLAILLLASDLTSFPGKNLTADLVRAFCFVVYGCIIAHVSTRLKRSRIQGQHLNHMLTSLRLTDQILIRAKSPDEAIREICEALVRPGRFSQLWFQLNDPEGLPGPVQGCSLGIGFWTRAIENGQSLSSLCRPLRDSGCSHIIPGDLKCPECPMNDLRQGQPSLVRELRHNDRTLGVMCISGSPEQAFTNLESELMEELGDDIAFALHHFEIDESRIRAEQSLQSARDELEKRVSHRTAELRKTTEHLKKEVGEHERTQKKLRQNEEMLRQVVQGIGVPAFVIDRNHRIVNWNRNCEALTGIPADHMLGTGNQWQPFYVSARPVLADLVMEPDPGPVIAKWYGEKAHLYPQLPGGYEMENLFNYIGNRMNRWVITIASPIRDDEGNIIGAVQTLQDITERKRGEESVKRSEMLFRSYFELPLIGIGILSPKQRWMTVNDKLCELLGYTRAELIRHSWHELVFFGTGQQDLHSQDESGEPRTRRLQLLRKDGRTITAQVSSDSVYKDDGSLDYVVVLVEDITELEQAERQMRESEQRFRSLFEEAAESIIIHEFDGTILEVNHRLGEITGFTREALLGTGISDLDLGFAHEDYRAGYLAQVSSPTLGELETRYRRKDGSEIPVEVRLKTMVFQNQQVILVMARDIAQRKQNETKMAGLLSALEEKNRELSDFAYVVSHDLKAPLRAISSLTNWIASDYASAFDDSGRKQLQLLLDRSKRLHDLIDGILEYSRIGRTVERMQPVYLTELVQEVSEMLSPPAHIAIHIENTLPTLICERNRMFQVFQNLIGNAVKFMDKPSGEIRVGSREMRNHWRFYIKDNGCGIDPRYHERVFQIFQTLQPKDRSNSTGIGLTIVKRIVEHYGGRIWIESEPKQGSTFFFTIPKRLRAETKDDPNESRSAPVTH